MARNDPSKPLRIAALIKQVPRSEAAEMTREGRLRREGIELEMNAYCRRAVGKGVELARLTGGTCTVFTLGPPAAREVLDEALACGADEGVHVTDPLFAGSDTLATARALAAALGREGSFDLILVGRNSVDADTGQVGPELAELLGLPFLCGVRELELDGASVRVRCEYDDGYVRAQAPLPLVMSVAERLCSPAKASPEERRAVPAERIRQVSAGRLGPGPWGLAASPTRVDTVRLIETSRVPRVLDGPKPDRIAAAVRLLCARGAFAEERSSPGDAVPARQGRHGPTLGVVLEPGRARLARELCGAAARLAHDIGGSVTALLQEARDPHELGSWGGDRAIVLEGAALEEDVARAALDWAEKEGPWAILVPSTSWGREVAARVAARLGAGLTGDATDLEVENGRLIAWKPAFGGKVVAKISARSPVQMATVRPGALPVLACRDGVASIEFRTVASSGRITVLERTKEGAADTLARAPVVVGVGTGVSPEEYGKLEPLIRLLGAELAATRKVTDRGWLPRARQVGLTGRSISPSLYIALGIHGKLNHTIGVRNAGVILAINRDRGAPIFDLADIGLIGDWQEVVPLLVEEISRTRA